jgi:hypothetical protein
MLEGTHMAAVDLGDIATAITVSGAVLLVLAALAKIRSPQPAADVLRQLGLPAAGPAVPILAGFELVAAGLAPLGGVAGLPLAACYTAFAVVGLRWLISMPGGSCGCFGSARTPVTALHPVITGVIAAAAAAGPWTTSGRRLLTPDHPAAYVLIGQVALLSALFYAALAVYPQLVAAGKAVA